MRIAYNPKTSAALTVAPSNNDITFDLSGMAIYARGVKFDGKAYNVFKKYTSATAGGYNGLVPAPSYNNNSKNRFLKEDGTWSVPVDTTYGIASDKKDGLVPKFDTFDGTIDSQENDWILTNNNGTIGWYKLPTTAFNEYVLPVATKDKLGGIRIGFEKGLFDINNLNLCKQYPILLNKDNQAYVDIPWVVEETPGAEIDANKLTTAGIYSNTTGNSINPNIDKHFPLGSTYGTLLSLKSYYSSQLYIGYENSLYFRSHVGTSWNQVITTDDYYKYLPICQVSYIVAGTASPRWVRIAKTKMYTAYGIISISNSYNNNPTEGVSFVFNTNYYNSTKPSITQIGGSCGIFTKARIVRGTNKDNIKEAYIEVYYDSNSVGNGININITNSYNTELYIAYTAGSIPTDYNAYEIEFLPGGFSGEGFKKTNSSDSYVLLGGGGHKLISDFTGLYNTGTVTSVAISNGGGIGISGSPITSSGTITISNAGVRSVTIGTGDHVNKLAVNTNGTTAYLTIPYAANANTAVTAGYANEAGSTVALSTPRTISLSGAVTGSASFDGSANITIATTNNSSVSGGGDTWGSSITVKINGNSKTLKIPSEPAIPKVTDYYWANIKVSNVESTTTTPTFGSTVTLNSANNVILNLTRTSKSSWRFLNDANLKIQNNYTSAVTTYFDVVNIAYNTGNVSLKGSLTLLGTLSENARINFSRGSNNDYPYNYITAPTGGIITMEPGGLACSSTTGYQFTSDELRPGKTDTYNLGTPTLMWKNIYATTFISGTGTSDFSAGIIKFDTINIPTTSGGTTYGKGTDGQVLKSNGSTVYWASDSNTDTKVTQTVTTSNISYPLLLAPSGQTTTTTTTAYFDSGVTLNPSTNTLSGIGNISISGAIGKSSKYLIKPNAEYIGTISSQTGAITITLPASIGQTMVSMWIDVYNYVTNTSFSVHVGGYTYSTTWANNPFAMVYGAEHKVRLGHNGTNFIIYIGELDSSWAYPQIAVRDVLLGYTPTYSNWIKQWTINFTTDAFKNVTKTIQHYAYTTKNLTPGTVTSIATGTGLTGGPITTSGTISISSTYQTYISNGNTAYGWGNHANAGYIKSRGYIGTTDVSSSSNAGQNITGVGNITPNTTKTYTLGTSTNRWKSAYINDINISQTSGTTISRVFEDVGTTGGFYLNTSSSWGFTIQHKKSGINYALTFATTTFAPAPVTSGTSTTYVDLGSSSKPWGNLYAAGGKFYVNSDGAYHTSDIRKKTNITKARNLDIADLLVEFDWKESGKHSWGYIAQDLLEVLPEAVDYNEDTYSVNYNVAHSAAIASLTARIKELEEKLKKYGIW